MFYLLLAVSLTAAACQRKGDAIASDPEWIRMEGDRIERQHRLQLLQLRAARIENGHLSNTSIGTELESGRACLATLRQTRDELRQDIAGLEQRNEALRQQGLRAARASAAGRRLPELKLASGRVFRDVTIVRVSEIGLEIRHASGVARIGDGELSLAQREEFGIDPELAATAAAREQADARSYEAHIDRQLAAKAALERKATRPAPPREDALAAAAARVASTEIPVSPLHETPRYFGGVRSSYYRTRTVYYDYPVYRTTTYGTIWQPPVSNPTRPEPPCPRPSSPDSPSDP